MHERAYIRLLAVVDSILDSLHVNMIILLILSLVIDILVLGLFNDDIPNHPINYFGFIIITKIETGLRMVVLLLMLLIRRLLKETRPISTLYYYWLSLLGLFLFIRLLVLIIKEYHNKFVVQGCVLIIFSLISLRLQYLYIYNINKLLYIQSYDFISKWKKLCKKFMIHEYSPIVQSNSNIPNRTFHQSIGINVSNLYGLYKLSSINIFHIENSDPQDLLLLLFSLEDCGSSDVISDLQEKILFCYRNNSIMTLQLYLHLFIDYIVNSEQVQLVELIQNEAIKLCQHSLSYSHRMYLYLVSFYYNPSGEQILNSEITEKVDRLLYLIQINGETSALSRFSGNSINYTYYEPDSRERQLSNNLIRCSQDNIRTNDHSLPTYQSMSYNSNLQLFNQNLQFWTEVCYIANYLSTNNITNKNTRTTVLRNYISDNIISKYLPSLCIYAPIGYSNEDEHYVNSIIVEESFTFSTSKRSPIFICLEVISNNRAVENLSVYKSSWWSFSRKLLNSALFTDNYRIHNFGVSCKDKIQIDIKSNDEKDKSILSDISSLKNRNYQTSHSIDIGQWLTSDFRRANPFDTIDQDPRILDVLVTPPTNVYSGNVISYHEDISNEFKQIDENSNNLNDNMEVSLIFRENWHTKEIRYRDKYINETGNDLGDDLCYKLIPVIIKAMDELKQEQMISSIINLFNNILNESSTKHWLKPYSIIAINHNSGIIEAIPDTISLDALHKSYSTLLEFYQLYYHNNLHNISLSEAQNNFCISLATYSIVCYLLQIKDRHNGNILIDIYGHIIHIDYGFAFGLTPGGNMGFESAPFKLTSEMIELLGGCQSKMFFEFRFLCVNIFIALRRQYVYIVNFAESFAYFHDDILCFHNRVFISIQEFKDRFKLYISEQEVKEYINCLIDDSIDSWTTSCYDKYQRCCVGII